MTYWIYLFIFIDKGYPNLFEYLTIFLSVCKPPVPHTPSYYREGSLEGGLKMLARYFEVGISWISWVLVTTWPTLRKERIEKKEDNDENQVDRVHKCIPFNVYR